MGASLGSLGVSWAVLVRFGCVMSVLWVRLGAPGGRLGGVLERFGGVLGLSWEDLGRVWGHFGSIFE